MKMNTLLNDYCEIGTIMNRDTENYNHFHNPLFIKYFYPKLNIELDEFDENLIKKKKYIFRYKTFFSQKYI
jgi:hypothetical protein